MYSNYTTLCNTKGIAGTNFAKFFTPEDTIYDETKNRNDGEYTYKEFFTQENIIKKPEDGSKCGKKQEKVDQTKDIVKRLIIIEEHLLHPKQVDKDRILKQCMITEIMLEENVSNKDVNEKFKRVSNLLFYDIKNNTLDNHKCYAYAESIKDIRYRLFGRKF
jgi:hypothetical protein